MKNGLVTLLSDSRTCLVWLRILQDDEYDKEIITEVIKRVDEQITIELLKENK